MRLVASYAVAVGILIAFPALADVPSPTDSSVPDQLTVAARDGSGTIDPSHPFSIVVRHFGGRPFANAFVVLDFSGCTDLAFCTDQGDPNVTVDCNSRTLRALSDNLGQLTFRVGGGALNNGASPGPTGPALNVYADGVLLKTVRVAALDENGEDGLGGNDHSAWLADFMSGQQFARSDFDGDGVLSGNDLSLWLAAFFGGASAIGCGAAVCP
jgi:hypothetical protein